MLDRLTVRGFTAFSDVSFKFRRGLNVIVGENDTGKTHVLKLAYALAAVRHEAGITEGGQTKQALQRDVAERLRGIFRPDTLGRLVKRPSESHRRATVSARYRDRPGNSILAFNFTFQSRHEVTLDEKPETYSQPKPIYLPTREVLSLAEGGFVGLYDQVHLPFDVTYYDLARALDAPPAQGRPADPVQTVLRPLEEAMGGRIKRDGARFYFNRHSENRRGGSQVELSLLAEGYRKVASLAYLLQNRSLHEHGMLLWDEPEANLNPRLIRVVAEVLYSLAAQNFQIIIATHSYFLMQEIDILARKAEQRAPVKFFGLSEDAEGVLQVEAADGLHELRNVASLQEELAQYDRELEG